MKRLRYLLSILLLLLSNTAYSATVTATYQYDNLDRLEKAEFVGSGYMVSYTYTYDDSGNLLNVWIESPGSELRDTDNDGIDDDWERLHFDNLTTANAITDFDKDGYSDLVEFLNWHDGILDPEGYGFDPIAPNASGEQGYSENGNILLYIVPILINNSMQKD